MGKYRTARTRDEAESTELDSSAHLRRQVRERLAEGRARFTKRQAELDARRMRPDDELVRDFYTPDMVERAE